MKKDPPGPGVPLPELQAALKAAPDSLLWRIPGIHLVDKPGGMTSHDVVAMARKRLGLRRVGHGGTLDPMATGLLLILAGNATRLFDSLQGFPKTYETTCRLGLRTDTQDSTGTVLDRQPVPPISDARLADALQAFRGEIEQVPPMYSALKKDGKPLYRLAREGKEVERKPRRMTVYRLEATARDAETVALTLTVSRGFYVRTLIDDLGQALGCGATMTALRRTAIGPFDIAEAISPERLGIERLSES